MRYYISYWCMSHIGYRRGCNQDNFVCAGSYLRPNGAVELPLQGSVLAADAPLFGVFDGMGGEALGEVAALLAAKSAAALTLEEDPATALRRFCQTANEEIVDYAQYHAVRSMGTTAAMVWFTSAGAALCNIGDSKIFRFSHGTLEQLSQDHLAVAPYGVKPPLLQSLGTPPSEMSIEPYVASRSCHGGEQYLLCSDGLTDLVPFAQIESILACKPIEEAGQWLLHRALSNGGRDNITILLCAIHRAPGALTRLLPRRNRFSATVSDAFILPAGNHQG